MATIPPTGKYVMHGARDAMLGGLAHIDEQVKGIERAAFENPSLAFDLAKTVVESACRTILTERSIACGNDDDLPRLFKLVTTNLPLLPVAASNEIEARKSLAQTLNGLHTALQGVCELRNACGFASHGADGPRPIMESAQALLAAQAADAIVGFLYRLHRQERSTLQVTRLDYDDNEDFNRYIDEANEQVRIFDLAYQPSEVLFGVDNEAYRDLLAGYVPDDVDAADEATTTKVENAP
ncbi:MAG TPA: abortive infection family protein [Terriglobia bacterium]|nr:abortive infection family protein [Terriglobia bacterium]